MQEAVARPSLKNSWAYQYRIPITAVALGGTWAYVGLFRNPPEWSAPLDWSIDAAAWFVFLGGAIFRIWATLWIAGRKKQVLVDDGPYRMCRNPLYLGTFAMAIGIGLFLKSLIFGAGIGLVLGLYLWFVVPAEEGYMRSRFGSDYDSYCRRSPRWLPRPDLLRRDEIFRRVADRQALYRECWRMACWMVLPVLAELTSHLRG